MESELDMYKILEELSNWELRLELKERQLNYKGTEDERRERLETWLIENGHDPNFYEFKDREYISRKEYMDSFMKSMESILRMSVSETENVTRPYTDREKLAVTNKGSPIEETPKSTEDTTPAGASALYPIAALVSVETKNEEMVNGSTLGEIKVLLPWSEESGKGLREELGEEDGAEETSAEFNSAVDVVQIEAADSIAAGRDGKSEVSKARKAKSMPVVRVCDVLGSEGDVDSATLLTPEFRTEPLGEPVGDHRVVSICETVDLRKSPVADIRIEPHELLVLLFIMFSNFIGMTFGTGGDPAIEGSLMRKQSKDSVPRVKMKNRRTMVNSLFGTNLNTFKKS